MVATTGIAIELQDKTKQGARAITRSLDDIKKSARETATSVDKLDDNFDRLKDELKETGRSADKAGREFDQLAGKAKKASDATGGMGRNFTALKGAFAAVGTSVVVKQFFDLLDVSTQINNRLKLVTDSTYALGLAQQQLFEVSQKSRVGFDQTVDLYSRLARSSEELGLTQTELVDITETISQAITISGASAQAADAALMQLGQGIASGALRGEELNSVLEQTPRLAQAIADGMGVSIGQLRALGAEGALTSETVVKAIQTQQGAVRTEFGQTSATIGQSMTKVTNSLTKLVSEIDKSAKISDSLASSLSGVADQLDRLSDPKSVERGVVEQIGKLIFDMPLFETLSIFTAPSMGDTPSNATTAPLFTLLSGITDFFESEEPKAKNALTGYLNTLMAQQDLRDQREKELEEAEHIFNEKLLVIDREFNQKLPDVLTEAAENIERGIDGLLPARVRAASYRPSTGPRVAERGPTLLGPVAVDESVFGFQDVIAEVDKALADLEGAFNELLPVFEELSPGLAKTSKAFEQIFTSAVRGDILTSVATYAATLFSVFSDGEQETDKLANRMRILSEQLRNARVAAGEATDVFLANLPGFEDIRTQLLQPFDFLYESIRERVFDPAFLAARAADLGSEEEARIEAEISTIQLLFRSVSGGLVDVSQEFADALSRSGIEQSDLVNYQRQIRDIFFGGGDIVWEDLATAALSAREEFSGLSDSLTQSAEQAQRLNEVEQAATRLRVNAQEIALRTQLSQEFRRAGSDVFEQRAAYAVRQLQYVGRAGAALTGGGGAGASTTAATTTATGATAATTTGATTAGVPPINATVAINAAMVTPDQLVQLPSEQDMQAYYSGELLPVLSDPVAPILAQFSDNIRANKVRIYPWSLFDVPSTSVWSSYWSRFLLARADTEETGPDSVSAQILENASANKKYISPFTLFDLPTADDWSSYWSRFLLGRADTAEHGPDNVAAQILDNAKTNKKRINPGDMFTVPTSSIWSTYWSVFLLGRADTPEVGPDNVSAQILDNTRANKKRINPDDMFIVPTSSIWSSYWSVFLLGRADTDEHGPDNVAAQILDNAVANKKRINPTDLFSVASGDDFRSFWQQGLNSVVVTDEYGPGAAIAYTREYMANRKLDIKPTDLFSTPSVLDFFFLFADMVPNITTGLNSVLNNLPVVPVNVANLIDFDASGISEANQQRGKRGHRRPLL
jgi:tape measure domain-containing protein